MPTKHLRIFIFFFSFLFLHSCNTEDEYIDFQAQEKSALFKSSKLYNSAEIQNWLKSKNINLGNSILWEKAIVYSKNVDGSIILDIPIKREKPMVLERLIFTVGKNVEGQLWTFRSKKAFAGTFENSYKLTVHELSKDYEGQLIMYDLNTKKLNLVENPQYRAFEFSVCNRCHSESNEDPINSNDPIALDPVLITGPGNSNWDWDWGLPTTPIITIIQIPGNTNPPADTEAPDCNSFKYQNVTSFMAGSCRERYSF